MANNTYMDIVLYTVLYSFMAHNLKLSGLTKETFAVLFGFWLHNKKKPVEVSLSIIQRITGGTRPAIVQAIHRLESEGHIDPHRTPGRRTLYNVTIDEKLLIPLEDVKKKHYDWELNDTSTRQNKNPQNKKNGNFHRKIKNNTVLRVLPLEDEDGLPEV